MIALLLSLTAFAGSPTREEVVLAFFEEVPPKKKRMKVIRYAFRRDLTVSNGKDWGKVLCFDFSGPPNPSVIEDALARAKLTGRVKTGKSCDYAPREAFLVGTPKAFRVLILKDRLNPSDVRDGLAPLLHLNIGVMGIRTATQAARSACLEIEVEQPDDEVLAFATKSLDIDIKAVSYTHLTLPTKA